MLVSAEWVAGHPMQNGTATIPLRIPQDPRVLGAMLYEQVLVQDPAVRGGFAATDGYAITFGSRW